MEQRSETGGGVKIGETEGRLGSDRILWEFRMQYPWDEHLAEDNPDWDQCCTCWVFALSEREARTTVWDKFQPPAVMPKTIASCVAVRFETDRDRELEARYAA
jgi:hypothetical protein